MNISNEFFFSILDVSIVNSIYEMTHYSHWNRISDFLIEHGYINQNIVRTYHQLFTSHKNTSLIKAQDQFNNNRPIKTNTTTNSTANSTTHTPKYDYRDKQFSLAKAQCSIAEDRLRNRCVQNLVLCGVLSKRCVTLSLFDGCSQSICHPCRVGNLGNTLILSYPCQIGDSSKDLYSMV